MRKKELLKKLHDLRKEVKPDQEWQAKNRDILLNQIKAQTRVDFAKEYGRGFFAVRFLKLAYKPALGLILGVMIILGAWIAGVNATKNSLPGDFWYGVKLTSERFQVNFALNDEKKANLEMQFADRRLDEIIKLINNNEEEKEKDLEMPLRKFQESMTNVKSSLAKLEMTDKEKAVKMAEIIDEKTKGYTEALEGQQKTMPELAQDTEKAISASKSMGNKALSLIVEQFEAGDMGITIDRVMERVRSRVSDLEEDVDLAKADIDKIITNKKLEAERLAAAEEAAEESAEEETGAEEESTAEESAEEETTGEEIAEEEITEEEITEEETAEEANGEEAVKEEETGATEEEEQKVDTEEAAEEPEEDLPTIEEIKDKPDQAQALLVKAKNFLKNGSVTQAFDQVRQANEILTLVNKVIKANSQYLEAPVLEEQEEQEVKEGETGDEAANNEENNTSSE